jgi:RND superfamily putative drug exporter
MASSYSLILEIFDRGTKSDQRLPGRRASILVVLLFVLLSSAVFALAPEAKDSNAPTAGQPDSADSTQVAAQLMAAMPSSKVSPAFVVVSRDEGALDADDESAVTAMAADLGRYAVGDTAPEAAFSDDRTIGIVPVPLSSSTGEEKVSDIRSASTKGCLTG